MSVSEKVLDAIQLLTASSIEKAGYDRTIQAQILSCQDATIGKYRCRYQDATIYAYASNSNVTFNNGSYVYILIPNGDMSKEKTILGTTKKLGINYISQAEGDQAYDIIGNNCVTSNNKFYLDTSNRDYRYKIYQAGLVGQQVQLDTVGLSQYIKESSSLIVGATFKTNISAQRQYRGHYGITYVLRFLDNTSNKQVLRSYTVDEDHMIDNPYNLRYGTRQYQIFDIDGPNFIRLESIQIFNKDFPNAAGSAEGKLVSGDIEITKLELNGAVRMSAQEIGGVSISFYTPQGTVITDAASATDYKTIVAQVRIKGKLASAAQNIPFYWGMEDVGITSRSENYNKYLGRGWRCLNQKNIIAEATQLSDPVIEWVPYKDTYLFRVENARARDNRIKVAIVYDNSVITKEINIQNLGASIPQLTIESSGGTRFYYDIGHPTLVCKVNGEQPIGGFTYSWAYINNVGVFETLPETTQQNLNYYAAVNNLNSLKADIAAGTKFANAEQENLTNAEAAVNAFNFIQRVEGNKIYDVQINNITEFGTFKCSVYDANHICLGTCSLVLTNSLNGEDVYSLVINNGSATFQYNENGVAPNNKSLDVRQQIQGLSFTVYDNLGNSIGSDIIANTRNCKIRWQFPIKETMLVDDPANGQSAGTDPTLTYKYYDNKTNLVYGILQSYDIAKQRNQIKLTVDYKGMSLTAETDFTFAKQGQPGTNGTQYLVKLVPRTLMDDPPLWPMITKAGSNYVLNYGLNSRASQTTIGTSTNYQFFKAQLWHNGELVWQGTSTADAAKDGITHPTAVSWQMLANKYNSSTSDASAFSIITATNGTMRYNGDTLASSITTPYANIVKCTITWQGKLYFGTIPITTAWTSDDKYRVYLKDYTGWRYAIYTSDGMTPQYDNSHPFEFIINERINNFWEDISLVSGSHATSYTVDSIGNYKNTGDGTAVNANLIEILRTTAYRQNCEKNQWIARPISRYNGLCVNAAITCIYKNNSGTIIGRISVPIHFLLNKYAMANINQWDGNSVQLDDEGGFILSPQVGAGDKENDNSFTGVLMGQTRTPGRNVSQIGLLGYKSGIRTFFVNSKNGSALFGKTGSGGQITIDPRVDKALIYSGNFWKSSNINTDNDNEGLPISYTYRDANYNPNTTNTNSAGLLIDLSTPEIFFGSGKFYVTSGGILHATEANISGAITATSLTLGNNVTIPKSKISDLDLTVYVAKDGTIGNTPGQGKTGFVVSSAGLLQASNAIIYGTIYSSAGLIGGWHIDGNSIYYGTKSSGTSNGDVTLMSSSTFTRTINGTSRGSLKFAIGSKFGVAQDGTIYAGGAVLSGSITATSLTLSEGVTVPMAKISGTLSANKINGGSITASSINLGNGTFSVGVDGSLSASNASITGSINATRITSKDRYFIHGTAYGTQRELDAIRMRQRFQWANNALWAENVLEVGSTANIYIHIPVHQLVTGDIRLTGDVYIGSYGSNHPRVAVGSNNQSTSYGLVKTVNLLNNGTLYVQVGGQNGAVGVNCWTSDQSLKKQIKKSRVPALSIINKIQHREFIWKRNDTKVDLGYVAQEIKEVIPGSTFAVEQPDGSELLQISASIILPYVTKAVQQLSQKVDELTKEVERLKGENK